MKPRRIIVLLLSLLVLPSLATTATTKETIQEIPESPLLPAVPQETTDVETDSIDINPDALQKYSTDAWTTWKQLAYNPIVIESHKLLFFHVPKCGSTQFLQLFKRMNGASDWNTELDGRLHISLTNGLKYIGSYPLEKQVEMMQSPEWTKAIFVRDPIERLISAYIDKVLGGKEFQMMCCGMNESFPTGQESILKAAGQWCEKCNLISPFGSTITEQIIPFEVFVNDFMEVCNDVHWRPLATRLTDRSWGLINFVGHMKTLQDDARKLLEHVNAYDDYGKTGWSGGSGGAIFERNVSPHQTSKSSSAQHLRERFNIENYTNKSYIQEGDEEIMNSIMNYYHVDYLILQHVENNKIIF